MYTLDTDKYSMQDRIDNIMPLYHVEEIINKAYQDSIKDFFTTTRNELKSINLETENKHRTIIECLMSFTFQLEKAYQAFLIQDLDANFSYVPNYNFIPLDYTTSYDAPDVLLQDLKQLEKLGYIHINEIGTYDNNEIRLDIDIKNVWDLNLIAFDVKMKSLYDNIKFFKNY